MTGEAWAWLIDELTYLQNRQSRRDQGLTEQQIWDRQRAVDETIGKITNEVK